MKKTTFALMLMMAFVSIGYAAQGAPKEAVPNKKWPTIVEEPDQTDIFAIPLDEDADEQMEQVEELEHLKK